MPHKELLYITIWGVHYDLAQALLDAKKYAVHQENRNVHKKKITCFLLSRSRLDGIAHRKMGTVYGFDRIFPGIW